MIHPPVRISAVMFLLLLTACSAQNSDPSAEVALSSSVAMSEEMTEPLSSSSSAPAKDDYTVCENNNFPYRVTDEETNYGHGKVTFTGKIVSYDYEQHYYDGSFDRIIKRVAIVPEEENHPAYQHFYNDAIAGYTINAARDGKLYLTLGELWEGSIVPENSDEVTITKAAMERLMGALDTDRTISLTVTFPIELGRGTHGSFTYVCRME
jgi:hypothetical protein